MMEGSTTTPNSATTSQPTQAKKRRPRKPKPRKPLVKRSVDLSLRENVGVDIGDKYSQICEIDADYVITETRIGTSETKFRDLFEGKSRRRIVLEVGCHSRWISELLAGLGLDGRSCYRRERWRW